MHKEINYIELEEQQRKEWLNNPELKFDENSSKEFFYNLVMFPYPSGSRLHVGHWFNYSGIDIFGRYKKLKGFNVFQPLGYDSFGLPAENYAIKTGIAPDVTTNENIRVMSQQIDRIGGLFEDKHRMFTSSSEYYKWTQWLFLKLYNKGLAFQDECLVNWDPVDKTVIANEQILPDGTAERSGALVERKMMKQWFLKITEYAEELLNFDQIDWPEKTKTMQTNWIGKSTGSNVVFKCESGDEITAYTTRIDTLHGVSYVVLAPEHPLVDKITTKEQKEAVSEYKKQTALKKEIDRQSTENEKTGVHTGAFAINPINNEKIPVMIADYVIFSYGTGAVMGVPAHDERDFEFANKYDLKITEVIDSGDSKLPFVEYGKLINSGEYNGLDSETAKTKITENLKENNLGELKTTYRLRDWSIGRQRYWGCPIPVVYDPEGNAVAIPEEHLPWLLPTDVDYKPTGKPPLASSKELHERVEKIFGKGYTPEYDTMDAFVCSSFYAYRYLNIGNDSFTTSDINQKLPVDVYVGGPEHACMHLLYARFIHKFLRDEGLFESNEPFKRLVHQGIITKDGAKMSKSKGNVVNPDDYVSKFGSDIFRLCLMFQGPFTEGGDFSDSGIKGILRFRDKLERLIEKNNFSEEVNSDYDFKLNAFIKKADFDYENFQFNTVIAGCMEFFNYISKNPFKREAVVSLIKVLAPLAPHITEKFYKQLGGKKSSIFLEDFPTFDENKLTTNKVNYAVQINGKLRASIELDSEVQKEEAIAFAKENDDIKRHLDSKVIVKEIFVPGKIISFVAKEQ